MSLRRRKARKPLSMTSLVDVIFLLLLFFMLSSTFSKFAEVEISAGAQGQMALPTDQEIAFLRLSGTELSLNGEVIPLEALETSLAGSQESISLIVSATDTVTAQKLTDVLVALRPLAHVSVVVLGS